MAAVNGLRISGRVVINKLSGPVSIVILQPNYKSTYFQTYKKAPLFILFGDIHGNDANLCTPSKGVIRIHDIDFLNMLCSILNKDEVIDFCTEGGDLTNETIIHNPTREPMYAFHNLVRYCNTLNETYDDYKKIQKIRWHHTDIRFWTQYSPQAQDATQEIQKKVSQNAQKKNSMFQSTKVFLYDKIQCNPNYTQYGCSDDIFNYLFIAYTIEIKRQGLILENVIAVNPEDIYVILIERKLSLINYQLSKITEKGNHETVNFLKKKFKLYIEYIHTEELKSAKEQIKDLNFTTFNANLRNIHDQIVKCFNSIDPSNPNSYDLGSQQKN
jgi:hypothetical protein